MALNRVILLVYRQPGHGKSYLAERLKADYSLRGCKDQLEHELRLLAPVFQIDVVDRSYRWQGPSITLSRIAALGEPSPSATSNPR